jgi:hypothetical protein
VAFLNWRFGLTQMTAWRIEVAPVPGLSNVATPTKAIITIPITLYGYGNGDDAEGGGSERWCDGPGALAVNAAPGSLLRQHFLHYFSEEISIGQRGIRTSENTPLHALG